MDPWGCVIAENPDQVDVIFAEINLDLLEHRRLHMPLQSHRRHDLYGHITVQHHHGTHIYAVKWFTIKLLNECKDTFIYNLQRFDIYCSTKHQFYIITTQQQRHVNIMEP